MAGTGSLRALRYAVPLILSGTVAAPAAAIEVYDLKGYWRTRDGSLVEVLQPETPAWRQRAAPWKGTLVHVSPGASQIRYRSGHSLFRGLKTSGRNVTFEYAERAINPLTARLCGARYVKFAGTWKVDGQGRAEITGTHSRVTFEPPWERGQPCEVRVGGGSVSRTFRQVPRRNFSLRGMEISGFFHCQQSGRKPPFAPYFEISRNGRFQIFFPKPYFPRQGGGSKARDETRVGLQFQYKDPKGQWRSIGARTRARLARCPQPAYMQGLGDREVNDPTFVMALRTEVGFAFDPDAANYPVDLTSLLPGFWANLNKGHRDRVFRVKIDAAASGGAPPLKSETPEFSRDMMFRALGQRLDRMSRDLFAMPLDDVHKNHGGPERGLDGTKYEELKARLWDGAASAVTGIDVSVDVVNHAGHNDRHRIRLVLQAKVGERWKSLRTRRVVLGAKRGQDEKIPFHAPGGPWANRKTRVTFPKIGVVGRGGLSQSDLASLTGLRIVSRPNWPGPSGNATAAQRIDPGQIEKMKRFLAFGGRLQEIGKKLPGRSNAILWRFAGRRLPSDRGGSSRDPHRLWYQYVRNSLDHYLGERFKEFVRLHRIYVGFFVGRSKTGLDLLDREVRLYWALGRRPVTFGDPNEMPTWGNADHVDQRKKFRLSHSFFNVFLSGASALLNPNLSFRLDPDLFGLAASKNDKGGKPRGGNIRGATKWAHYFPETSDEFAALRKFDRSKAMQDAYNTLYGFGGANPRLSPKMRQALRTGDYDAVKGLLFEEAAAKRALEAERAQLAQLKDAHGNPVYSKLLVLDEHQVRGGKGAGQLSDGMILGLRNGEWEMARLGQAKAGESGARRIFSQFNKDVKRLQEAPLRLRQLRRDQRATLGIDAPDHSFPAVGQPGGLKVDFADPKLYVPITVKDAEINVPRNPKKKGPGTDAIRTRMQDDIVRSPMSQAEVESLADLLFHQARVKPVPWHARNLNYDEFVRITKRSLGGRPMPSEDVLHRMFAEGKRINPETGLAQHVFADWERPVLSVDKVVELRIAAWRKRNPGKKLKMADVRKWRARARRGERFNPKTNQWQSRGKWDNKRNRYGGQLARRFILFPDDPTLSPAELEIWLKFSGRVKKAERADFRARFRQGDRVFNVTSGQWRNRRPREKAMRNYLQSNPDYSGAYRRRLDRMDKLSDGAERAIAAIAEAGRISGEHLIVTVFHEEGQERVYVYVMPRVVLQNGKIEPIPVTADIQRGLLRRYYRFSRNMILERELPPWLR